MELWTPHTRIDHTSIRHVDHAGCSWPPRILSDYFPFFGRILGFSSEEGLGNLSDPHTPRCRPHFFNITPQFSLPTQNIVLPTPLSETFCCRRPLIHPPHTRLNPRNSKMTPRTYFTAVASETNSKIIPRSFFY